MAVKQVIVCDGCGKYLEKTREIYKLVLKTNKFWDGIDTDYNYEELDFCYVCAKNIKKTLEKIANR